MVFNLNCNINAWIRSIQIEASSEEEAINKLKSMSLTDLIEEGAVCDTEVTYDNIDTDVTEYTVIAKVTDIEYDLDPEIMDTAVIEYLKNYLPKELTVTIDDVTDSDDIEDLINDAIFSQTKYDTKSFEFQILETK
jgi:hypothetical protein